MGNIKIMSESLANKIAAGEVVERPLSVVKELVENSIDAGSSKIYITLKNSGVDYIRVVDDGVGMDKDDALLCFNRHASSKLTSDEMLFKIATLGFRGEALSSIAAVSNVMLETCNEKESTLLEIEAGTILKCSPTVFRKGTTITVTKLFYNTPARLKYIKNLYTESAKIVEYVSKCALANPNIVFKLMNDGKSIIETSGSNDYLKTIRDVYSVEIVKNLSEVNIETNEFDLKMFVAKPSFQRSSKNYINVFVNRRVINSPMIIKTVINAFKDYLPRNRFPFCIINIEIEPELIDVNIHPNKYEIKFSKDEELLEAIENEISKFLKEASHKVEYTRHTEEVYEAPQLNLVRESSTEEFLTEETKEEKLEEFKFPNIQEPDLEYEVIKPKIEEEVVVEVVEKEEEVLSDNKIYYEPIGQFNGTYILAQGEDELILIDQHAAVERINYEKNQTIFKNEEYTFHDLLVPLVISLSLEEATIIKNNVDYITKLGIDISEFGSNDFVVRRVPSWIENGNEEQLINLIINKILEGEKIDLLDIKDDVIELISCKESLKANTKMSVVEMEYTIDTLFKCSNPYHCPHGRPIIISLTLKEIEKLFKRVM